MVSVLARGKIFYLKEMYCVSYFTGKFNFQPSYPSIADDVNHKAKKMNGASCTMPGMSGTTTMQGKFKKRGQQGGARKGDSAGGAGENK